MNASAVAKHYDSLTPEERFALILAAVARGDEAEWQRLASAASRVTFSMPDHAPMADAFMHLAFLFYLDLLEEVARYDECFFRADSAFDAFPGPCPDEGGDPADGEAEAEAAPEAGAVPVVSGRAGLSLGDRCLRVALAGGFVLRTKAEGWKLFCTRRGIPPLAFWDGLPGFDRLRRALDLTDKAALTADGFLRWLNEARPDGKPALTVVPLSVAGVADVAEALLRKCLGSCDGA
jgi:hypothetical protein